MPRISEGLKWAKDDLGVPDNGKVTLPTYLRCLREWVNYSDSYLFFRLYGESVKTKLDHALNNITFLYLIQTEYYMIHLFGWEPLRLQFETFIEQLTKRLGMHHPQLEARFSAHRRFQS